MRSIRFSPLRATRKHREACSHWTLSPQRAFCSLIAALEQYRTGLTTPGSNQRITTPKNRILGSTGGFDRSGSPGNKPWNKHAARTTSAVMGLTPKRYAAESVIRLKGERRMASGWRCGARCSKGFSLVGGVPKATFKPANSESQIIIDLQSAGSDPEGVPVCTNPEPDHIHLQAIL